MTPTEAVLSGFNDRVKTALLPELLSKATPALSSLGRAVVGGGMRAAKAVGAGEKATGLVRQGLRSSPNFMRNVGAGALGAGALGAAGAGYAAGR